MRILLVALSIAALLATPALADDDWSLSLRVGEGETRYHYGWDYYWGDYVDRGMIRHGNSGLSIGYHNGDWQASYTTGPGYYGTHPNDRPGYRVYIPRGLEPGYIDYGDFTYNGRTTPQVRNQRHRRNDHYYDSRYGYNYGYPYSYGPAYPSNGWVNSNGYYYYPQTVVYAPARRGTMVISNGEIYYPGYDDGSYTQGYYDGQAAVEPEAPANYDYSTTNNYYYGEGYEIPTPPTPAAEDLAPTAPVIRTERPFGHRFYADTMIPTPDGKYLCLLGANTLSVEFGGVEYTLSEAIDPTFGAFANWHPQAGFALIYRAGSQVIANYQDANGHWWEAPLGLSVQFAEPLSLGMVGERPWLVFTDSEGRRVVMSFENHGWLEIGSGSVPGQV